MGKGESGFEVMDAEEAGMESSEKDRRRKRTRERGGKRRGERGRATTGSRRQLEGTGEPGVGARTTSEYP